MLLLGRTLQDVDEGTLNELIGTDERRVLDFKRELPGQGEKAKVELAADASSLANTAGGHLVFGVDEEDGRATAIRPITGVSADAEIRRLEQTIRSKTEPTIPGLVTRDVPVSSGFVLVMQVPRSFTGPHAVRLDNDSFRFFSRDSRGKRQMDFYDVRASFLYMGTVAELVRRLRNERISSILAGETPHPLEEGPKMALHFVPASAFDPRTLLTFPEVHPIDEAVTNLGLFTPQRNADGVIVSYHGHRYMQFYRNGAVEMVVSDVFTRTNEAALLRPGYVERMVVDGVKTLTSVLPRLGVESPAFVFLSLLDAKGAVFVSPWNEYLDERQHRHRVPRDVVMMPDLYLETFEGNVSPLLRPMVDAIWNIGNIPNSPNFDRDGNYAPAGGSRF